MIKNKQVTVRDIAKEAKVSAATVSRVLNDSNRVTEPTKKRVQKVIDKYKFKPNAIARTLFKKESKLIGCILPDITNQYFAKMFLELEKMAHHFGYTMFLCNSMNDFEMESIYLTKLVEQQVDGIIFMGGRMNESIPAQKDIDEIHSISSEYPIIIVNGDIDDDNVHMINPDVGYAIDQMVKYLADHKHKSIGFIGGRKDITVTEGKRSAFQYSIRKYGLLVDQCFVEYGDFNSESGYAIFKKLVNEGKLPDALITINDEVAVGVLHACLELGIKVPEDISVMGYDNVEIAQNTYPRLTSFSHPYEVIGRYAIETLHKLIHNEEVANLQLVRGKIVERESVR